MISHVTTNAAESARYRSRLDETLRGRVLDGRGRFCCTNESSCRGSVRGDGFAAGQLSYVGDHYATRTGSAAFRVLVVSMQVGDDEAPVTMRRRREQVRDRIPEQFGERNQHMAGVTTALRVLFGGQPGDDRDGEFLETRSGPVHVLDAYAMANSVLCSRRPGAGREGAPTTAMIRNCSAHLRDTIDVLQPTIIQSQGRAKSGSTRQAIEAVAQNIEPTRDEHVSIITIDGRQMVWCSLRHPARNWGQLKRAYLHDVAAPALHLTRQLAFGL